MHIEPITRQEKLDMRNEIIDCLRTGSCKDLPNFIERPMFGEAMTRNDLYNFENYAKLIIANLACTSLEISAAGKFSVNDNLDIKIHRAVLSLGKSMRNNLIILHELFSLLEDHKK